MPQELVERQANSGRREPQRLDTGSANSNQQRDAEWFGLATADVGARLDTPDFDTPDFDTPDFDTRRR